MEKRGDLFGSQSHQFRRYVFWAIVALLIVLSYFIVKSYVVALVSAFILAYLAKPLYDPLSAKVGKGLAAALCVLVAVAVIIIPVSIVVGSLASQTYQYFMSHNVTLALEKVLSSTLFTQWDVNAASLSQKGVDLLLPLFRSALTYIPSLLGALLITLFGMYYILVGWDDLAEGLKEYLPFEEKEKISKELSEATRALVYGTLFVAFIEFVIAAVGFYLVGVPFYLLLAALIFFTAFVPGVGPVAVWAPTAAYYLFMGNYLAGIGALIIGCSISFGVEVFILPRVVGRKSRIHPLVVLVGILGGVALFGIFGFIIGPLVLTYTLKLLHEGIRSR